MAVTLEQVAQRAGVSRGAASFVLRDHPKARTFSEATVARVRAAADELGYRPNFFQTRRNRAQLLMCYVASLQDLYAASIVESFQNHAAQRGYWVTVHAGRDESGEQLFDQRIIGQHGIAAVALIGGICGRVSRRQVEDLVDAGVRVVVVGRHLPARGVSHVLSDNRVGGRLIGEHLRELGVSRVAMLAERDKADRSRRDRERGLVDAVEATPGMKLERVLNASRGREAATPEAIDAAGYQAVRARLAARRRPPQAVVTQADLRAMGAYRAIGEAGLRPGLDIAVVGYTDIWPAGMLYPTLTTVHEPTEEMGRSAAGVLIDQLEGHAATPRTVELQPTLKVRDSTAAWAPSSPEQADG